MYLRILHIKVGIVSIFLSVFAAAYDAYMSDQCRNIDMNKLFDNIFIGLGNNVFR